MLRKFSGYPLNAHSRFVLFRIFCTCRIKGGRTHLLDAPSPPPLPPHPALNRQYTRIKSVAVWRYGHSSPRWYFFAGLATVRGLRSAYNRHNFPTGSRRELSYGLCSDAGAASSPLQGANQTASQHQYDVR